MDERERFGRLLEQQRGRRAFDVRRDSLRPTVDGDGNLDFGAAGAQRSVNVEEINILDVPWPEEPYGFQHAQETAALAVHIAQTIGGISPTDLNALRFAGMFHDVCRARPWQEKDDGHSQRSADYLERFMQKRNDPTSLIERAVLLVARHDLSARELPRDPLAQALWDADSLEAARLSPGTPTGLRILRQRNARLCTAFARERDNQATWMRHRGWQL